ncbi:RNA polymerase Rpb1, domain 2 [Opisthorchis viverrini]|uniref:DNA-directed RNA polymerase subunit n=1 Tax=Opisthorchis viverrini TaxID=6198 RepID=A0A1S8X558_OPIVI|nr:RNA polymerase Rpb1, domain 2 [Opisthorchis viverrini]
MFSSTDGQFERLGFRFYNRDDIRLLSVRQVTNELAFDKFTGRGVDGGLHDASMGTAPFPEKDLCGHCGLDFFACPGHFGHIEFSKPVFNPLFFDLLFKLMKAFCFGCFRIYSVDYLAAALHHLGAAGRLEITFYPSSRNPASTLPGKPKQTELAELEGLSETELTKIALRSLSSRPRVPCKLCCTRSWVLRHINKQQLVMRPVSENARSRSTASEMKMNEEEESIEDFLASAAVQDPRLAPTLAALADGEDRSFFVEPMERKTCSDVNPSQEQLLEEARKQLNEMSKSSVNSKETCLLPETARLFLRCLWTNDASLLRLLFPMLNSAAISHEFATDVFFMDAVLLSPSICRLPRYVGGLAFEHPETAVYSRVVRRAQCLSHIVDFIEQRQQQAQLEQTDRENAFQQSLADLSTDPDASLVNLDDTTRIEGALKLACILLQAAVNGLYDMNAATIPTGLDSKVGGLGKSVVRLPGLRQRLEKKEGLFRMHIMGKRVNYACRSVISPDPILDVTEVGVPLFFATRLTFPTPVNMHNLAQMRQLVSNGPEIYPGARSVQTPEGQLIHLPRGNTAQAKRRRETLAGCLIPVSSTSTGIPFVVNRHVLQGDMLVMNRQPTLHKPSMQAHRVRIIHSTAAKTLRMHYSNCRAYNADFDGDEMNGHLVQSYTALAELESLASVPSHYLGPKDGAPLAGLIQDHVIAAVKLTMRDRFFDQSDYLDLVYDALRSVFDAAKYTCSGPPTLVTLPPAVMWPKRLWTGKQVVSTLLINLTPPDLPYINCTLRGRRTKAELWSGVAPGQATPLSDVDVVVCDGYLVSGMLDKAHIGSSSGGLIHCVHELHGPKTAAHLLNGISLLANRLLKFTAFTMGIKDMLLSDDANEERSRRFVQLRDLGLCAFADAFELDPNSLTEHEVRRLYRQAQFAPSTDQVLSKRILQLDNAMKNRLKRAQDAVCDSAIPSGLYVGFPENNLQLMVHVGAKGGMVNAQQMSVALGQIELEGRRVPLMLSGRSLPSFPPYDVRPRAGGMCTHRFLTSLPPQELFFHSMAGRDGLVDTAVKTSRSGYLQRSAIKHLEDLSIQYDGTVRDSGNNVIQFHYGDDGVDVCQASFLQSAGLHLFADNAALLSMRWYSSNGLNHSIGHQHLLGPNALPRPLQQIADQVGTERQMLLMKSPSEHKIAKLFRKARRAERSFAETVKQQKQLSSMELLNADLPDPPCVVASALRELCLAKLISAQVPPGEPVGLLAAQSVGEPSTQMTLNTFHFAGRGEMNVTLGIPRLREILMSGSPHISTPCMEVPVRSTNEARRRCIRVAKRMYKLKLLEV